MRYFHSIPVLAVLAACSSGGGIVALDSGTGASPDTGSTSGSGTGIVPEGAGTGTGIETSGSGTSTGTDSGIDPGSGSGTQTGSGPGYDAGTSTGSGTGTGSSTGSGSGSSTGTGTGSGSSAPTWTQLWTDYLSVSPTGCINNGCHQHNSSCGSASACYSWLNGQSGGVSSACSASGQVFSWDQNGWMPPSGPSSDPSADAAFAAWIAAGAMDN